MNVAVCDVGARDGLQNEDRSLPPERRAELANRLAETGLPRIEAASFVQPSRVPQMAGAEELVALLEPRAGVAFSGLALNEKGYRRLLATPLREAHFSFGCTEEFNRRNQNASVEESIGVAERLIGLSHGDGVHLTVTIGVAFGCPFEGAVDPQRVLAIAERLAGAGGKEICFADTIGVGVPSQARHLVGQAQRLGIRIGAHFHDTRNTGIANALAALEAGAGVLDASVGGIGGCPFAPRATGNIATEDLVYLLDQEGVETGVDLDALIRVAVWLEGVLEKTLPGRVYRAGNWPG
ncbi:MAG: hydroxymethylglutaryl-CoA lyase [Actinomycetota bacterium]|nr:hydroxymethylglutaryl-CoA lyase [Actinomycetota bacterium]